MKKTKPRKSLSRRKFLGTVGTATAGFTIIPRHVMPGKGYMQPSDTVNVAGIGIGARGASNLRGLCDPDVPIVNSAAYKYRATSQQGRNCSQGSQDGKPTAGRASSPAKAAGNQGHLSDSPIFMHSAMWIPVLQHIFSKVIRRQRYIPTGGRCLRRKNRSMQ